MTKSISGNILPNNILLPAPFNPETVDENVLKAQYCQSLKAELALELNRSSLSEIVTFFEEKGDSFLIEMFTADPWQNVSNKGKSVLENVLEDMNFNLPEVTLRYLLTFYMDYSTQAQNTNMNMLHILARNCYHNKAVALLESVVAQNPQLLKERMILGDGLDMTPVEMAIRTSYNEKLINFLLTKYLESVGVVTATDKAKLLSHAQWLSGSGVYHTALMGKRLMERISTLPVAD